MSTILFLEDDPDQSASISAVLNGAFPEAEVVTCDTESELLKAMDDIAENGLYFAVLDAMVPWCFPSEEMPVPPRDVQAEGIRFAGKRCLSALRHRFGNDVPIWIYSILSTEDHGVNGEGRTFVLEKQPENGELLDAIHAVI